MPVISGGVVQGPGQVLYETVTFTEDDANDAAGTYDGSVTVPAGSLLLEVQVHAVALWNSGSAVNMDVGDAASANGIFVITDLKATDLVAAEGISAAGVAGSAGGEVGADLANTHWNRRYLATARVITGTVTCAGASGTTGVTRMTVFYTDPTVPAVATFTAT